LSGTNSRGVHGEDLARVQRARIVDLIGSRIALRGPKPRLKAASAQAIGPGIRELAINAGKYGSLSTESDRVDVTMHWSEREGAARVRASAARVRHHSHGSDDGALCRWRGRSRDGGRTKKMAP
jgi:two-component sensor histidine kinase